MVTNIVRKLEFASCVQSVRYLIHSVVDVSYMATIQAVHHFFNNISLKR